MHREKSFPQSNVAIRPPFRYNTHQRASPLRFWKQKGVPHIESGTFQPCSE